MLTRWLKMWLPFDSRIYLSGVQRLDGSIATEPSDRAKVLREHWQPVFQKKQINKPLARTVTAQFQPQVNPNDFHLLREDEYESF